MGSERAVSEETGTADAGPEPELQPHAEARVQRCGDHYQSLLDGGTKPNLAKQTIARQIGSIMLALWRSGETYDPKRLEATD